jgi:succinate dehydrogenase / fumarate reductase cytochrome b subunit
MQTDNRPRFLDLRRIRLPLPGFVSILHRASGLLLVAAIPAMIYAFDLSLRNAEGFEQARTLVQGNPARLALLLVIWSLAHHLSAGIRFLLLDVDIGIARPQARASAWGVLAVSLLVTALAAWALFA